MCMSETWTYESMLSTAQGYNTFTESGEAGHDNPSVTFPHIIHLRIKSTYSNWHVVDHFQRVYSSALSLWSLFFFPPRIQYIAAHCTGHLFIFPLKLLFTFSRFKTIINFGTFFKSIIDFFLDNNTTQHESVIHWENHHCVFFFCFYAFVQNRVWTMI